MLRKFFAVSILTLSTLVSGIFAKDYERWATDFVKGPSLSENIDSNNNNSSSLNDEETSNSNDSSNEGSSIESTSSLEDVVKEISYTHEVYHFVHPYRLYINPSVQYHNAYYGNLGSEGRHMNDLATILVDLLNSNTNLIISGNLDHGNEGSSLSLSQSVSDSNKFEADYHLALHSNAGGGSGSEIWTSSNSEAINFGKTILNSINEILPYQTRGIKDATTSLYEIKNTKAKSALLEVLFHDEQNQANFIINNKKLIAEKIFEGIVQYFSSID